VIEVRVGPPGEFGCSVVKLSRTIACVTFSLVSGKHAGSMSMLQIIEHDSHRRIFFIAPRSKTADEKPASLQYTLAFGWLNR
jgi:hypothetical protein